HPQRNPGEGTAAGSGGGSRCEWGGARGRNVSPCRRAKQRLRGRAGGGRPTSGRGAGVGRVAIRAVGCQPTRKRVPAVNESQNQGQIQLPATFDLTASRRRTAEGRM